MGIFSSIKNAIFGKDEKEAPKTAEKPAIPMTQAAPAKASIVVVDVEELMEAKAAASSQKLNWRTSIVDLMKLLDLDSSLANRKELAEELGYTGAKDGSAEMNIWLHKAVMRELAKNGGKVPAELID
ncbi:MAG: DUF3597 domain-containing protein [Blastomonas sp.]